MEKKGTLPARSERRPTNAGLAWQNSKIAKAHFEFKAHEEHYFVHICVNFREGPGLERCASLRNVRVVERCKSWEKS
jgi:hypothetical protein